ncbi:MAG: hypothetical protein Q7K28_00785 [Candidatus Wildermuthbacteria bacterium]|nr:hypothetical protein [Candidatus Wildermuthbacteria bacterium]
MLKAKDIFGGFIGGAIGGMAVDLIFITFIGPSALFTLFSITGRYAVFFSHVILGGIMGVLFIIIARKFVKFNFVLAGLLWGYVCLIFLGAIPSLFTKYIVVTPIVTFFSFLVWSLYGVILAVVIKAIDRR